MTLDQILGIAAGGGSILSGILGNKKPKGLNELLALSREQNQLARQSIGKRDAATRSAEILNAMTLDESSPFMRKLIDEQEGNIRRDMISAVSDLRRANNRAGGKVFINPERRDEAVSSALARRFATARGDARNNVRNYLAQTANRQLGAAGAYSGVPISGAGFQTAMGASDLDRGRRQDAITGGLQAIYRTFRPQNNEPQARQRTAGYSYPW